jgi:hypothetical protein
MDSFNECQIPGLQRIAEGDIMLEKQPWSKRIKRLLAKPWNYTVKKQLKKFDRWQTKVSTRINGKKAAEAPVVQAPAIKLQAGDWVRVRSREEIEATLDKWKELKGCAFLEYMGPFCGTNQRVLQVVERFLDERDYKVKKSKGVVLLEGVICRGTPVFGRCDRCCHLFWREEWLEKIEDPIT